MILADESVLAGTYWRLALLTAIHPLDLDMPGYYAYLRDRYTWRAATRGSTSSSHYHRSYEY